MHSHTWGTIDAWEGEGGGGGEGRQLRARTGARREAEAALRPACRCVAPPPPRPRGASLAACWLLWSPRGGESEQFGVCRRVLVSLTHAFPRLEARERDEDAGALHSPAAPHGHAADVVLHVVGAEARALVPRREALRVPTELLPKAERTAAPLASAQRERGGGRATHAR